MEKKIKISIIFPVLLSFFVMSFCDLVGISVDNIKEELNIGNSQIQLITSFVFVWFFFLSIPVGVLQDRFGKKNILNIGIIITALGLFIPFFTESFVTYLVGFAFLGIGNTIVQVSANPLLVDVVPSSKSSSFLSFSQFIKSIGSMVAPFIAAWFASYYGDWKLMFLAFGIISVISVLWLSFIKVEETKNTERRATIGSALSLLKNPYIALMALGIFFIVGIDVGINAISGQYLQIKFTAIDENIAKEARSIYFFGKMLGTFAGAFMLVYFSSRKFFIWTSVLGLASIAGLVVAPGQMEAMIIMFIVGLGVANIFPLIFSLTIEKHPTRANEISGLMIRAISGGAAIPPLMGFLLDYSGLVAGMMVLVFCAVFELLLAFLNLRKSKPE